MSKDDYEDEIVIVSLMKYHALCSKPNKIDNTVAEYIEPDEWLLWAIERVLGEYMRPEDFKVWLSSREE